MALMYIFAHATKVTAKAKQSFAELHPRDSSFLIMKVTIVMEINPGWGFISAANYSKLHSLKIFANYVWKPK